MQEALHERAHLCADEIKELVPKKKWCLLRFECAPLPSMTALRELFQVWETFHESSDVGGYSRGKLAAEFKVW